MGAHSRNKGRAWEQAVARDLRAWLGDEFSVKRLRTDEQRGMDHAGEFQVTGPWRFPWAVECKAHASFDVRQLWKTPISGPFPEFWRQCAEQARACARAPLLVINVPRGENLAVMRHTCRPALKLLPPIMALSVDDYDTLTTETLVVVPWKRLLAVDAGLLRELP